MTSFRGCIDALLSGDDDQAEIAARELAGSGEAGIRALKDLLVLPDPDARWWAARALAGIEHPEVPVLLCSALKDEDVAVCQCAALGLYDHPSETAIPDLIAALNHEDRLFARLASNALIAIGKGAVPALLEAFQNRKHRARLEAVRALAEIGDKRAVGAFFRAINDGDSPIVEHWADIGLDKMGIGMTFFKP